MDQKQAKTMDERIVGVALFCEDCGENKVLSPCYSCQLEKPNNSVCYCRGCGFVADACRDEESACKVYDICRSLARDYMLVDLNELLAEQELENEFFSELGFEEAQIYKF